MARHPCIDAEEISKARVRGMASETRWIGTNNVPDGQAAQWSNPQNNTSGYTRPVETVENNAGQTCRTFQTGITAQGQSQSGTGTACRQPDGTWKIMR